MAGTTGMTCKSCCCSAVNISANAHLLLLLLLLQYTLCSDVKGLSGSHAGLHVIGTKVLCINSKHLLGMQQLFVMVIFVILIIVDFKVINLVVDVDVDVIVILVLF
jgi:hypothetical protein